MVARETCHATTMHGVGSTAFLHDKKLDIDQQVEQALEFLKERQHDLGGSGRGSFAMLQGYYCRDMLEWLFAKGLSTRVWDQSDDVTRGRVWELFGLVLSDESVVAGGFVFPSAVTTGLIHAILNGVEGEGYSAVLHHVGAVVDILATKFRKEFVIHLEHAVTVLESALIVYKEWKGKGKDSARKVWEAIVVRHLGIICELCFGTCDPRIKKNLEAILSHAMFSRESLLGLHQLLVEGEGGSEQGHYARKLFSSVDVMIFVRELESRQVEKKSSDILLFDRCGEVMDLHAQCCRRDPNIKPLWGQNTRPDFESYHSVFNTDTHVLDLYITSEDDAEHHSLPLDSLVAQSRFLESSRRILVEISRGKILEVTRYLEKKISKSKEKKQKKSKKRKMGDEAFDMHSALLLFPQASMNEWKLGNGGRDLEKALTWMISRTNDHSEYPVKGKKFSDIVLKGYAEISLLCQLHHVQDDVFGFIQSACFSDLFYCALILSTTTENHVHVLSNLT
eukprot:jgi/Picre1/29200/NNA_004593.t1